MPEQAEHTFVILAHNESPYLIECITSLKSQSVKSRILMATSTPSDYLRAIASRFDVPLIENKDKGGIGADWTFAYKISDTKHVTLAHQDDIYLPEYTKRCLSASKNSGGNDLIIFTNYSELVQRTALVHHGRNLMIKDIVLLPLLLQNDIASCFLKNVLLRFGNPISCPTVMFNKDNIGYFYFHPDFICTLDWDAWVRIARKKGTFAYVKDRLVIHRIYDDSQSYISTKNKRRKEEETLLLSRMWPKPMAEILANIHYYVAKPTR